MPKFGFGSCVAALLAASLMAGMNAPAMAKPIDPNGTETAAAPTADPASKAQPAQRYCVVTTPTGSHIRKRVCMTRAEWLREGFDPLAQD